MQHDRKKRSTIDSVNAFLEARKILLNAFKIGTFNIQRNLKKKQNAKNLNKESTQRLGINIITEPNTSKTANNSR